MKVHFGLWSEKRIYLVAVCRSLSRYYDSPWLVTDPEKVTCLHCKRYIERERNA